MNALLVSLLKAGGTTALVCGVFFLLYRQLLGMKIFSRMGPTQTFVLVGFLGFLIWAALMTALFINDKGMNALVFGGQGVVINQSK